MLDFEEKALREFVSEEIRDLEVRKHTYTYYIYLFTDLCWADVVNKKVSILQRSFPQV